MRVEQLRLDANRLTMEEIERYSFILGDTTMHDTLVRAEEELALPDDSRRVGELEDELQDAEDREAQASDERDHLHDGLEAFAKFLRSSRGIPADRCVAAAEILDAYLKEPYHRGSADTMDDALVALAPPREGVRE